jgi:hypothetical protein
MGPSIDFHVGYRERINLCDLATTKEHQGQANCRQSERSKP